MTMIAALVDVPVRLFSWDDVLSPYIYVFYVAFLVAFFFTPIMRLVALYYGIIDQPDRVRKMHTEPVAYLGGIAVFLGWLTGVAISQGLKIHHLEPGRNDHVLVDPAIVIGAVIIIILGLWDDIRGIRPAVKITGQIAAAVTLLWNGIGTDCLGPIISPVLLRARGFGLTLAPDFELQVVKMCSSLAVVAIIVACCNAANLMDGLDGLCGGVTAVVAAGFVFLTVHMAMYSTGTPHGINEDGLRIVLSLALLAAILGFVPFNFNPASIFMGDTGSMFLGFSCATLIVLMGKQNPKWFLAGMVMFALPMLDTGLAFARRYVNKRPLFSADRNHFHHQLVSRGFSVKQTVLISYGLSLVFGLLGMTIVFIRTRYSVAIYLVVFGSIIVAAFKMGMIHERPRVVTRRNLAATNATASSAPLYEAGTVLEVRDSDEPTPRPAASSDVVPGSFEQPTRPIT